MLQLERLGLEDSDGRLDALVLFALKGFQKRFENDLRAVAGHGHADLLADTFLCARHERVLTGESPERGG